MAVICKHRRKVSLCVKHFSTLVSFVEADLAGSPDNRNLSLSADPKDGLQAFPRAPRLNKLPVDLNV